MRRTISVLILCGLLGATMPAAAQSTGGAGQQATANQVGTIDVREGKKGTHIRIRGTSEPTFSVFKLTNPLRLFVDISNSTVEGDSQTQRVGNGVISKVALIGFEENSQSVARLIIGFDEPAHYDVKADGDDVVVFVDGEKRESGSKSVSQIEDRLERTQKKLASVESTYEERLDQSQTRYKSARSELDQTRDALAQARDELTALKKRRDAASGAERREVQAKIDAKNDKLARTEKVLKAREAKVASLQSDLQTLRSERDEAVEKAKRLEAKYAKALEEARQAREEGQRAKQRASTLENELASARENLDSVADEKDQLKQRLDSLSSQADQSSERVESQVAQLEKARQREQSLESQVAKLRTSLAQGDESVRGELEALEKEKSQLSGRLEQQEDQLAQARSDARRAQKRASELQGLVQKRESEVSRLRAQLKDARQKRGAERSEALSQLQKLQKDLEAERNEVAQLEEKREQAESDLEKTEQQLAKRRAELESLPDKSDLPAAKAVPVDPNASNSVRDIKLETRNGRSRIVVELDRPSEFESLPWKGSRAIMILNDVELPDEFEQTLSSDAQGGAVRFVSTYTDEKGEVRMEAELDSDASELIRQDGNKVVWEFAPKASESDQQQAMRQDAKPTRSKSGQSFTSAPPNYPRTVTDPSKVNTVPGMKRTRLTIDLRSADIQNVLRLLAKEGGVNIITGDNVSGAVTMRLRSVPLDQVFLTILQSQGLGFETRGNVIRVATQEKLLSEQKARAEARARAEKLQPLEVFLLPINYASADELQSQVESLLSPRGSVSVDDRTNTLIIKDLPENLSSIRSLVENLDSQVPQVLIEARIVETNDTFSRQLGIQWGGDVTFAQGNGNPTGLIFPSVIGIGGGATDGQAPTAGTSSTPNFAVNLPAPAGTGAGGAIGLTMGSVGGGVNLNLRLSAMEEQGHAKIVSAPKIMTLDNREATISQGTSIPISVVSAAGVQTVFVDATLELTVLPHVTPDGNIQLQITATKNEPDFQNTGARGDPTIIRKQAETELLIKDGDTTVIGGIYTRNAGSSLTAVPFFHKIPILGHFFKTTSQSERRTELLIFITPRIVNRAESLGVMQGGQGRGTVATPDGE
ncbi:MAG: type IV pilus secretin PilQ [Myxococcota bacterium]